VSKSRPPEVVSVTTARRSHTEDIALRERRYVLTQMVRVACVLLGVLLPAPVPVRLVFFSGAVFLPWFGVVMANAGPALDKRAVGVTVAHGSLDQRVERLEIEPGRVVDAER
jgi:hypothetical protein